MPERGPAQVAWLTMFLDLAPAAHAETAAFWASVTGSTLSAARGDDGEFATLLPADGDAYLRVQRLGGGPSRVHLDVHAADLDALAGRAVGLGAEVVRRLDDVVVLRSPGGFPLCAVAQAERTLSAPVDWGTHTSRMDQVCLDVPRHLRETETRFWAGLLGEDPTPSPTYPEFTDLRRAAHLPLRVMLQEVGHGGAVTGHADLGTDDREAEVARHVGLGAERVQRFRGWTVMRDPSGLRYCVTDQEPIRPRS